MTKQLLFPLGVAALVLLTTTAIQAQGLAPDDLVASGALTDYRAVDNFGQSVFRNQGTLGGELGLVTRNGGLPVGTWVPGEIAYYSGAEGDGFNPLQNGGDILIDDAFSYEIYLRRTAEGFPGAEEIMISDAFQLSGEFGPGAGCCPEERVIFELHQGDDFGLVDFSLQTPTGIGSMNDVFPLPLGEWVHFALTFDEASQVAGLYVDGAGPLELAFPDDFDFVFNPSGEIDDAVIDFGTYTDPDSGERVGANNQTLFAHRAGDDANRFFPGDISASRLYDRVLSAEEVRGNFLHASTDFVPEPTSVVLAGLGLVSLFMRAGSRRRR